MNRSDIGNDAAAVTRSQFAEELTRFLRLTAAEIDALFPEAADQQELARLTELVRNAASVNEQRAALVAMIPDVAGAVLKLLRHAVIPA